jgi:hypothetical protein
MTTVIDYSYVFSNWLFFWFVLYAFKFTTYNPKLILELALLHNFIILFYKILITENTCYNATFVCGMIFMKVLPLYVIRETKINCYDVRMSVFIYSLFLIWLRFNDKELFTFQFELMKVFIHKNYETPTESILKK